MGYPFPPLHFQRSLVQLKVEIHWLHWHWKTEAPPLPLPPSLTSWFFSWLSLQVRHQIIQMNLLIHFGLLLVSTEKWCRQKLMHHQKESYLQTRIIHTEKCQASWSSLGGDQWGSLRWLWIRHLTLRKTCLSSSSILIGFYACCNTRGCSINWQLMRLIRKTLWNLSFPD